MRNEFGEHQIEGLVDSKIRSHGEYSNGALSAEPDERVAPYDRTDTGAYLIVILLLSLGLWAAIWGAVASLSAIALR